MLCERCHGAGKIAPIERIGDEPMQGAWVPCPDCDGLGISSHNIQLDPSKIDWVAIEQEAVRKPRLLRDEWRASFDLDADFHRCMVLGIYMRAIVQLAAFCDAVPDGESVEGDHG
jgi:hypothetical protein